MATNAKVGLGTTISIQSLAQEKERPIARELIDSAFRSADFGSRADRIKFVNALSAYCKEFLTALPTNTPTEDAWVQSEMKTSDTEKINRLSRSAEYGRWQSKRTFQSCADTTANILRIQKLALSDQNAHAEAGELLRLAFDLNEDGDIRIYASRAGMNLEPWKLDLFSLVRRTLIVAALRAIGQ